MKRIHMIITGGTIGSKMDEHGVIRTSEELDYSAFFPEGPQEQVEIRMTSPCLVLSENMNYEIWEKIISSVEQVLAEEERSLVSEPETNRTDTGFAGIMILHGSDTLSYTTALLGYLYEARMRRLGARLAVTGANAPLSDPSSNGRENLKLAFSFLLCKTEEEPFSMSVRAAYDGRLFDADRILEADSYTDRFHEKPFTIPEEKWAEERRLFLPGEDLSGSSGIRKFSRRVQVLKAYPGFDHSLIDLRSPACPKAFLHVLYHSGTGSRDLLTFMKRCRSQGILSFCVSVKRTYLDSRYETTDRLMEYAEFLCDMTPEWAFASVLCRLNAVRGPEPNTTNDNINRTT